MLRKDFHSKTFQVVDKNWDETISDYSAGTKDIIFLPTANETQITAWNDERKFIEELINKRFTFLISVFAAVVAGVIASKNPWFATLVTFFGLVISIVIGIGMQRSYAKTSFLISAAHAYGYEPIRVTHFYFHKDAMRNEFKSTPALSSIGRWTPWIVWAFLAVMFITCLSFATKWINADWPGSNTDTTSSSAICRSRPGRDGKDGRDGRDGKDGKDGKDVTDFLDK